MSENKDLEVTEFEDLLPCDDIEDSVSFNALDFALSNPQIKNIAFTGNYGSGKSSILKSYIKQHSKHKYIEISLASFTSGSNNDIVKCKI
jgi:DNA replication protein DnaC